VQQTQSAGRVRRFTEGTGWRTDTPRIGWELTITHRVDIIDVKV